eukprot:PITA_27962
MESWLNKNWAPLIKGSVTSYFLGQGFFLFKFSSKEDKDLIFHNGPYFMGPQGLYLNRWMPDFDPAVDVPSVVPIWVRLPNLPVHCWNWDSLKHIGNALGKFIDRANSKDQYHCARICVEVDLEVVSRKPSKSRGCPTNEELDKGKEEGWNQVKCTRKTQKQVGPIGKGTQAPPHQPPPKTVQENKFASLSLQVEETQEPENQKSTSPSKGTPKGSGNGVEQAGNGVPAI